MAPIGTILETDHLSREVGSSRLVDDITLEVREREVLAVGASGAGRSSFHRLLNRLDEPTGGTVPSRECSPLTKIEPKPP